MQSIILIIIILIYNLNLMIYCSFLPDNLGQVPEETQHAVCRIISDEVTATANASITRQLKGVCSSNQMNNKFNQLEKKLLYELNIIKYMLESAGLKVPPATTTDSTQYIKNNNYEEYNHENEIESNTFRSTTYKSIEPVDFEENPTNKKLQYRNAENPSKIINSRELEVLKFNNTIHNTNFGKAFLYYWVLFDIYNILNQTDTFISSPEFYVTGFRLQIHLIPHHLNTNYVGIQLQSNRHFVKKHRFMILNKQDAKEDLTSQLLADPKNYATMYRVSLNKIAKHEFLTNDNIIIKVAVYLNI